MPKFVSQLEVPLIAVADSRRLDEIYFQILPGAEHFKENWHFTKKGFELSKGNEAQQYSCHFNKMHHKNLYDLTYKADDLHCV